MKVDITLVLHLQQEVNDDVVLSDDKTLLPFVIDEHCIDNHIEDLHKNLTDGVCSTCSIGKAFVGHIPFKELEKAIELVKVWK